MQTQGALSSTLYSMKEAEKKQPVPQALTEKPTATRTPLCDLRITNTLPFRHHFVGVNCSSQPRNV